MVDKFNLPLSADTLVLREWFWDLWDDLDSQLTQDVTSHEIKCYLVRSTLIISSSYKDSQHDYNFSVSYVGEGIVKVRQIITNQKHPINTTSHSFMMVLADPDVAEKIGDAFREWCSNPWKAIVVFKMYEEAGGHM